MQLEFLSNCLEDVTHPNHPYYHLIQIMLFGGVSYISAACFTSIPPIRGMTLIVLTYAISQLVTPLFIQLFESYQDLSLFPLIGQVLQLTSSLLIAKSICQLAGQTLSFKEVRLVGMIFLISLYVSRFVLLKFRQQLQ